MVSFSFKFVLLRIIYTINKTAPTDKEITGENLGKTKNNKIHPKPIKIIISIIFNFLIKYPSIATANITIPFKLIKIVVHNSKVEPYTYKILFFL